MDRLLIHVSDFDLKVGEYLDPKKSRQTQEYICTTPSIEKSIIHTSSDKDEQLQVFGDSDGIFERYKGAFENAFKEQKRFIYYVTDEGAVKGQFDSEFTFSFPKKIVKKETVECAYSEILRLKEEGKTLVHEYPELPSNFIGHIDSQVVNNLDLLIGEFYYLQKNNRSLKELKNIFENEIPNMNQSLIDFALELSKFDLNYKAAACKMMTSVNPPNYCEDLWQELMPLCFSNENDCE